MNLRPGGGPRLGLALALVLGLAGVVLPAPLRGRDLPGEVFGRWQRLLPRCRILLTRPGSPPAPPGTCGLLRLDQQMEGLLTVRFLQPGAGGPFQDRQLVFAGVLQEGSPGMRCRQSRCEPHWPLRLRVSAVGQSGYGALVMALARAQLASGHCLLEPQGFRCEATGAEGEQWRAEGSL